VSGVRAAWHVQVWEDEGGYWHWDVRSPGLRSTGERLTAEEAFEAARTELELMRGTAGVTSSGL
jgi:hypothetical protein